MAALAKVRSAQPASETRAEGQLAHGQSPTLVDNGLEWPPDRSELVLRPQTTHMTFSLEKTRSGSVTMRQRPRGISWNAGKWRKMWRKIDD